MIANAGSVEQILQNLESQRIAVVAAHPDDETIGAGSLLSRLAGAQFVFTTDGAPRAMGDAIAAGCSTREEYATTRRREAENALTAEGIDAGRIVVLPIADQEASLRLPELARGLIEHFTRASPEVVLTHPYEGGHPDHDATAFAVHAACALLPGRLVIDPVVAEMASYHNGPHGICTGEFLPHPHAECIQTIELSVEQQLRKRELLARYVSQQRTLKWFGVAVERFRVAPKYVFTDAPHAGTLFYEQFDWGMKGERWRQLAAAAIDELGLSEPL